ncbi:MAG: anhydro-N-acetylmuramic acid kinase [Bacteroidia bacterium]
MELSLEKKITVIGLMSGTSTDGIDLVAALFQTINGIYQYEILDAQFIPYDKTIQARLLAADELSGRELKILDRDLAIRFSNEINSFKKGKKWNAQLIASHGHTVFHDPAKGYTLQIASGAIISALTGLTVVSDFRQSDVSLGGQGAPLVPIGDLLLFNEYSYCLNLGGFANISVKENGGISAYDICPLNVIMNSLSLKLGKEYDKSGEFAQSGKLIPDLLNQLNKLPYYQLSPPKSLGTEWVKSNINPLIENLIAPPEDLLHTYVEHAASQIADSIRTIGSNVLVTGGGSKNDYLLSRIRAKALHTTFDNSQAELVDFKEALIFAFLGYLRIQGKANTIKDVTGAERPISSGAVYLP